MNKFYKLIFILLLILLSSCNPKISKDISMYYSKINNNQDIMVFGLTEFVPYNTKILGTVKVTNKGLTLNCDYDIIIDLLKKEAGKVGGDAIKIIDHKPPKLIGSSCHRITAEILKIEDFENCSQQAHNE